MTCNQCGADVPEQAAFCPQCGASLAGNANVPGTEPRSSGAAKLMARGGRGAGNQPAEEELWSGTYSPKAMIGWFIGAALLSVAGGVGVALYGGNGQIWKWFVAIVLILWAIVGLVVLYRQWTVRYRLTTFRLFHETGLLRRKRDRIEVIDIDDVTLTQGFVERMFNVGTIHVLASDESLRRDTGKTQDAELIMPGIDDARQVADLIDNTRRAERERRGLFMENV
jgi:membrane protein YdbS with pleckstrin-like domain